MAVISRSLHLRKIQSIISTGRVITRSYCRHWWITHVFNIYVGWPGSVHDAWVLANSSLYNRCESGDFFPNWTMTTIGNWGQLRTISNNWQHHHPSCDFGRPCLSYLLMATEALLRHWLQQKTNKLQQLFKTHSCGVWKCLWKTEEKSLMKNNGDIKVFQLLSPFVVVYTTSAKWTGMQAKKHGFVLRRSQVTVCSKGWIQQLHKVQGQGFRKHYKSILRTIDTDTRSAPHPLNSINSRCC